MSEQTEAFEGIVEQRSTRTGAETSVRSALVRNNGVLADVDFILAHRYVGKRVRVTIEVLEHAPEPT